jgi:hypothetical protein
MKFIIAPLMYNVKSNSETYYGVMCGELSELITVHFRDIYEELSKLTTVYYGVIHGEMLKRLWEKLSKHL